MPWQRGLVFVSDPLENISLNRQEVLQKVKKVIGDIGGGLVRVLDLMEQKGPELILASGQKADYLGIFNPGDREKASSLDLEKIFPGKDLPLYWLISGPRRG